MLTVTIDYTVNLPTGGNDFHRITLNENKPAVVSKNDGGLGYHPHTFSKRDCEIVGALVDPFTGRPLNELLDPYAQAINQLQTIMPLPVVVTLGGRLVLAYLGGSGNRVFRVGDATAIIPANSRTFDRASEVLRYLGFMKLQ